MSSLDAAEIQRPLTEATVARLDQVEVFSSIDSTNTYLLAQAPPVSGRFRVAIADEQTAGRGRLNRRWISPPGAGLYLSLAYTFVGVPAQLPTLTLALGVGVIAMLEGLGERAFQLKWPNDIIAQDRKLGGILTEARSSAGDGVTVVAGVGLNVDLPDDLGVLPDGPVPLQPVSLAEFLDPLPPRESLAAALVEALVATVTRFERSGFESFADDWERHDWLKGRRIVIELPVGEAMGIAAGVGADGALVLEGPEGRRPVASGSITSVGGTGVPV